MRSSIQGTELLTLCHNVNERSTTLRLQVWVNVTFLSTRIYLYKKKKRWKFILWFRKNRQLYFCLHISTFFFLTQAKYTCIQIHTVWHAFTLWQIFWACLDGIHSVVRYRWQRASEVRARYLSLDALLGKGGCEPGQSFLLWLGIRM